jgi:hypothetical protein
MHGTLRARYQLTKIDPSCIPWGRLASEYLWFRVVEDSVSFDGEYGDDDWISLDLFDKAETDAAMSKYLATLLTTTFEAAPNKVTGRFSRHLFKSVIQTDGAFSEASDPPAPDVEIGGRAVLVPMGVSSAPSADALGSLEHVLLRGRDFAVAVRQDVVMAALQPALDLLDGYGTETRVTFQIAGISKSADYYGRIGPVSAAWQPAGSSARIVITAECNVETSADFLPDFAFTIIQPLHIEFGGETLAVWAEDTTLVPVDVDLPDGVWETLAGSVGASVQQGVGAVLADPGTQSTLRSFVTGSDELAAQLQKMDGWGDAGFDEASFYASGIVFRGWVSVASRRLPEITFEKIDDDGFSALKSWIPGGRIDELHWSWSFGWGSVFIPTDDEKSYDDRYVLRRQPGELKGFRMQVGAPLPGLDRPGQLCLRVKGVRVNWRTGDLEEFDDFETEVCNVFGHPVPLRPGADGLNVPEYVTVGGGGPHHPGPVEIGVAGLTGHQVLTLEAAANTLVVSVGDSFDENDAETIVAGLDGCTREDAGLLVTLVFPDGGLDRTDGDLVQSLQSFAERLPAPLTVNEDLDGAWSKALSIDNSDGGTTWQLFSPGCGLLWTREGQIEAGELSTVLDGCLYPSAPARPVTLHADRRWSAAEVGALFDAAHAGRFGGFLRAPCPAASAMRETDMPLIVSNVSFVQRDPESSKREVGRLQSANAGRSSDDPAVLLVVAGASEEDAERMSEELGSAFIVIPDPEGTLAAGAGVRFWPTTVAVGDQEGARS